MVIPTYNRAEVIGRAVGSVTRQTYRPIEIFVVDDASTDDTVETLNQLPFPELRVIRHATNQFAAAARNSGMRAATGEYIAFLDSDDTWLPDKLERQVALLESEPDAGICFGGVLMKKGRGYREKVLLPKLDRADPDDVLFQYMTGRIHIITTTFMFRRSLLDEVGLMDVELRRNQDIDFFIRMLNASRAVSIEEPLAEFFPNLSPPSLDVIQRSNARLLDKHTALFASLGTFKARQIASYFRFLHGLRHMDRGSFVTGLQYLGEAITTNPFLPLRHYASAAYKIGKRSLKPRRRRATG